MRLSQPRVVIVVPLLFAASALCGQVWLPVHAQEVTAGAAPVSVIELAPGVTAEIFPHGHPGPTIEDVTEPGKEAILNPGDAIFYEDDVVHTARGAGDTPAVVMGTLTGQPLIMPAGMAMATPAA